MLSLVYNVFSFSIFPSHQLHKLGRYDTAHQSTTVLHAKKTSPASKKISAKTIKGFSRQTSTPNSDDGKDLKLISDQQDKPLINSVVSTSQNTDDNISNSTQTEKMNSVFKKYGIVDKEKSVAKSKSEAKSESSAFGEKVLEKIPEKMQMKIDSILITCTFAALSFVVLSGIGISFGAFKIVFPTVVVSDNVDTIIKNVLTPAFTPSIGVFFLFSITLGLFKYAQISNSKTVYRED